MDRCVERVASSSSGESRLKISEITNSCDATKNDSKDNDVSKNKMMEDDVTKIEIKDDPELLLLDPCWQEEMF